MKQLLNIFNQSSGVYGQEPKGFVCLNESGFVDKRCLYT